MPATQPLGVWNAIKFTLSLLLGILALVAFVAGLVRRDLAAAIGLPTFLLFLAALPWLPRTRWLSRLSPGKLPAWVIAVAGALLTALLLWVWEDIVRGKTVFPMECQRRTALLCAMMNALYDFGGAYLAGLPVLALIALAAICTVGWACIAWARRFE